MFHLNQQFLPDPLGSQVRRQREDAMAKHRIQITRDRRIHQFALLMAILIFLPNVFWAQRACCEGDMWLKWSKDRRESYLWGYMLGYSQAYWKECRETGNALPAEADSTAIENRCRSRQPDFSKGTDFWGQQVTDFYKTYPGDRDIKIDEVLEQLRNGLTLEQIHKYPFMRRHSQVSSSDRTVQHD